MNFQLFNTLKVIFCWLVLQFTYRPTVRLIQVTITSHSSEDEGGGGSRTTNDSLCW